MYSRTNFGISLPTELVKKIDTERGDVPRSKYLLRILEKIYDTVCESNREEIERTKDQNLPDRNGIGTPDGQVNSVEHRRCNLQ